MPLDKNSEPLTLPALNELLLMQFAMASGIVRLRYNGAHDFYIFDRLGAGIEMLVEQCLLLLERQPKPWMPTRERPLTDWDGSSQGQSDMVYRVLYLRGCMRLRGKKKLPTKTSRRAADNATRREKFLIELGADLADEHMYKWFRQVLCDLSVYQQSRGELATAGSDKTTAIGNLRTAVNNLLASLIDMPDRERLGKPIPYLQTMLRGVKFSHETSGSGFMDMLLKDLDIDRLTQLHQHLQSLTKASDFPAVEERLKKYDQGEPLPPAPEIAGVETRGQAKWRALSKKFVRTGEPFSASDAIKAMLGEKWKIADAAIEKLLEEFRATQSAEPDLVKMREYFNTQHKRLYDLPLWFRQVIDGKMTYKEMFDTDHFGADFEELVEQCLSLTTPPLMPVLDRPFSDWDSVSPAGDSGNDIVYRVLYLLGHLREGGLLGPLPDKTKKEKFDDLTEREARLLTLATYLLETKTYVWFRQALYGLCIYQQARYDFARIKDGYVTDDDKVAVLKNLRAIIEYLLTQLQTMPETKYLDDTAIPYLQKMLRGVKFSHETSGSGFMDKLLEDLDIGRLTQLHQCLQGLTEASDLSKVQELLEKYDKGMDLPQIPPKAKRAKTAELMAGSGGGLWHKVAGAVSADGAESLSDSKKYEAAIGKALRADTRSQAHGVKLVDAALMAMTLERLKDLGSAADSASSAVSAPGAMAGGSGDRSVVGVGHRR